MAWLGLNHPAVVVLLFALARLGAVLVPLNHRLSPAEWQAVLADCAPKLLVHDAHLAAAASALATDRTTAIAWTTVGTEASEANAPTG